MPECVPKTEYINHIEIEMLKEMSKSLRLASEIANTACCIVDALILKKLQE